MEWLMYKNWIKISQHKNANAVNKSILYHWLNDRHFMEDKKICGNTSGIFYYSQSMKPEYYLSASASLHFIKSLKDIYL